MSEVANIIIQGSKEGVDQDGMDSELIFNRSLYVKSDQIDKVVQTMYDEINFAKTVDPRMRPLLMNDARTLKHRIASHSSINGKVLQMVGTTRQEHHLTSQTAKTQKSFMERMAGNNNSQGGGMQQQ